MRELTVLLILLFNYDPRTPICYIAAISHHTDYHLSFPFSSLNDSHDGSFTHSGSCSGSCSSSCGSVLEAFPGTTHTHRDQSGPIPALG